MNTTDWNPGVEILTVLKPSETLRIPGTIPNVFFLPGPSNTTVLFSSDSVTTTNSVPLAPIDPVGTFTDIYDDIYLKRYATALIKKQ